MKRITHFLLLFSAVTLATPALADVRVVTTTTDLADLVRAVGGEHVRVESICTGEQDPHHVQARPSYMVTVSRADLLVAVGLQLETAWLPGLVTGARNPSVRPGSRGYLEAASFIEPIDVVSGDVDRTQGDIHPDGNPHYWLDPHNLPPMAAGIAERLADLDPDHAAAYRANASAFASELEVRLAAWAERMEPYRGARVVSYHRTFDYFLGRYGLVAVGYVENRPGIPPSPSHLASLMRSMRSDGAALVLHESFYDDAVSERVAREGEARLVVLPVSVGGADDTATTIDLIDHLVSRITAALAASP